MKKLLLSLGALSAVVAPVAAVVACSSDDADTMKTGTYVANAYKDHATFANLVGITGDTMFKSVINDIQGNSLEETQANIKDFNEGDYKVSTSAVARNDDEKALIASLVGKTLKAELFYQQDNRGGMTFVGAGKLDATKFPEAATASFDTVNKGHGNALHTYGVRFVTA